MPIAFAVWSEMRVSAYRARGRISDRATARSQSGIPYRRPSFSSLGPASSARILSDASRPTSHRSRASPRARPASLGQRWARSATQMSELRPRGFSSIPNEPGPRRQWSRRAPCKACPKRVGLFWGVCMRAASPHSTLQRQGSPWYEDSISRTALPRRANVTGRAARVAARAKCVDFQLGKTCTNHRNDLFVKFKLTKCARAGNRAGFFHVRDLPPRAALDAQPGEKQMKFEKGRSGNPAGRRARATRPPLSPKRCSRALPGASPPVVLLLLLTS
jgi:hypothetical protein